MHSNPREKADGIAEFQSAQINSTGELYNNFNDEQEELENFDDDFDDSCVPDFSQELIETDKTDKTYSVTNWEFMKAIFGNVAVEARPFFTSFAGDPASGSWGGKAWTPDSPHISASNNNYFSIATFIPDNAGQYKRQKKLFYALNAIMLDDIGTKISEELITLPPSWKIETSSGNYQLGYILSTPLIDSVVADQMMKAIISNGLCDAGANAPTTRLARLPVAINGKRQPPFNCRLTEWNPDNRYSVEELIEGLQLEIQQKNNSKVTAKTKQKNCPNNHDEDSIFIPRPTENAVMVALRLRNLYKTPLGNGKHDITCPWASEHTGGIDSGTAYFEQNDQFPIGGFKCMHGHCSNRYIRDILQFLEIEPKAARMKPTIRVVAGEIHRIVDVAEKELASKGRYYQRGGLIVTIITDPSTKETRVQESNQSTLVQVLAGLATWERFDGRSDEWVRIDPPARHVSVLYDVPVYNHLYVLNGLVRQPYFRSDNTLVTTPNYDSASGMFGVFNESYFSVPESPTKEQAMEELNLLRNLLEEFRFIEEADISATISAFLAATVRSRLNLAPMYHVKAHQVGSGKSYLCQLIKIFATSQCGTPSTFPKTDEECRKFLLSELLRSPAVIEFDNLTSDLLPHKSLCVALTSEHITDRILGVSKTATVSTRTLFLSSGNNVAPVQDMTRRCITINIDPACEIPAQRIFKRNNLVQEILQERGKYISAALTIIRAWIVAECPQTQCPPLAGYNEWSDFCRQPLLWLGCADPIKSVFDAISDDPDRETLGQLLKEWHACFGNKPTMVREAVNLATSAPSQAHNDLHEVLKDIAEERNEINRRVLGRWIKRRSGRIVNGLRFNRASGSRSAEAWYVESVSSVL